MKIVFCVTNFGFLRNFQSTLSLLAQRGHRLHLVADRSDTTGGLRMVEELTSTYPEITVEVSPSLRSWPWQAFASAVRLTLDYWRYLDPRFADAVQLRARAERQVPRLSRWIVRVPLIGKGPLRRLLTALLKWAERSIPIRPEVADLLRREAPDLLLITPLLYFGSRQVEHVRAAQVAGVPTLLAVGSWDHLTTKGIIHEIPDYVAVWNHLQKDEAVELHHVPADRIVVTGAQAYDHWFERRPSTTREEFCRRVGVPADRPYVLYLCSSPFITPYEVGFVRSWIEAIRGSTNPDVRGAGILIRPHPQNASQWNDVDLSGYGAVSIWPRGGANPIDAAAKSEYFDSMFHGRAVVGVNTSGLIESGIVGRRVYSVSTREFASTQEGTLHFQHLKNVEGGVLSLAPTLDAHVTQLASALAASAEEATTIRTFVQAFVRPHGLGVAAAPRLVELVERVGAERTVPQPESVGRRIARAMLTPAAVALMLASIERDRWRSWAIQWTSRPRRAIRGAARAVIDARRAARRQGLAVARRAWLTTRGALRAGRRAQAALVRRSRALARRAIGGTSHVE
jgi:hypothetical protein